MCPACITSVAMIVASKASTGALSTLVVKGLVRITGPKKFRKLESKENLVMKTSTLERPKVVSAAEWEAARKGAAHQEEATDSPAR